MLQHCIDCLAPYARPVRMATLLAGLLATGAAIASEADTAPADRIASAGAFVAGKVPVPAERPRRGAQPARPDQTRLAPHQVLLSVSDREIGRRAMQEAEAGRFDAARRLAVTAREPMVPRLVDWLRLQAQGSGATFGEIVDFIDANPDWPAREAMQRRAEEAIDGAVGDNRVIAWFASRPPESGVGLLRYGEALLRSGNDDAAFPLLRRAWVNGNLPQKDEKALWADFGSRFSQADNAARTDRLLWDGNVEAARRMLPRLEPSYRRLAEVRIALAANVAGADKMAADLPPELRDDGGLAYDRLRWQRRRGLDDIVEAMLYNAPDDLGRAEKWWVERHFRARKAMAEGRISEAYRLAAGHGLKAGSSRAEAEWLAGWIALRLLQEPKSALPHFQALQESVRYPVSVARAAYWLGRTHEAMANAEAARQAYAEAARHPTTFYGQLAAHALAPDAGLTLPPDIMPTSSAAKAFNDREVVRAARMLVELGQEDRLRPFILRLVQTAESPEEHRLVAGLARDLRRVDLAIMASKRSARQNIILVQESFPLVDPMLQAGAPETALVLALARQESEFNQFAVSSAGARGLMQLMPATAKGVARDLKLGYEPGRLTQDASYNVRLGSHYLNGLLQNWDNNFVLALAGYNAGESRVRKWIRDWGDPRQPHVDVIDWIELIPFSETRNYVQRVLEGVQVYRALLGQGTADPRRLLADMRGAGLQACSPVSC